MRCHVLHRVSQEEKAFSGLTLASEHNAAILRPPDETKPALPFVQLAFARAEVALDAALIEAMPPLRAHDAKLDHLAVEYGHTLPSHSVGL